MIVVCVCDCTSSCLKRVVGFPLPVEGGGGGQQKHNSVQRLVNQ